MTQLFRRVPEGARMHTHGRLTNGGARGWSRARRRVANGGILPGTRTGEEDEGISDMLGSVPVR
jgi:hypothetical protein